MKGSFYLGFLLLAEAVCMFSAETFDPCCSYPCQNFGICNRIGFTDRYTCDCYGTGHYGDNCETATLSKWISEAIRPSPVTMHSILTNGASFWTIINAIDFVHDFLMKMLLKLKAFYPPWPESQNAAADYATWDGYSNKSYYGITLPAVPRNCPTPMGVKGPKVLPSAEEVIRKVFTRTKFKPCPRGTSLLLPMFGQHYTHQIFKTNRGDRRTTFGSHELDGKHIYGDTLDKQRALRTMKGGKMKMQIINGETYPPNIRDTPGLDIEYPPQIPPEDRFGLGHPFFILFPSLPYFTTLWLREHNRLCDILAEEHPDWDDERLYHTSQLIVLGETFTIAVADYVQPVGGLKFQLKYRPHLLHDSSMRWGSVRIHAEFNLQYHWHAMMPNVYNIGGQNYSDQDMLYNMRPLLDHGMAAFSTSISNQVAGKAAGGRNIPEGLMKVAVDALEWGRELRLRPFNHYRKYFRLPALKTFEELTGEKKLARVLSDLYGGDIDALEYFVGILVEKRHPQKMFGITMLSSISHYSLKSVFSNILGSPEYWRESTFGGKTGFDLVKNATLQDLVCRNVKGCPKVQMNIPELVTEDSDPGMVYDDLEKKNFEKQERGKTEL